jgi:DNA polymerase (family 10)
LEKRDPHAVDLQAVIDTAVETGTWVEINGGPERLDLPDIWVRKALDKGVTLVANSDAHAIEELDWMEFAVATARRGWLTRPAVANTSELDDMLARRKRRG